MKSKARSINVVTMIIFTVITVTMKTVVTPEYFPATTPTKTKKHSNSFTGYSQRNSIQMPILIRTRLNRCNFWIGWKMTGACSYCQTKHSNHKRMHIENRILSKIGNYVIFTGRKTREPGGLPSVTENSEGLTLQTSAGRRDLPMITYGDFFLFCTFIVSLISLIYQILKGRK